LKSDKDPKQARVNLEKEAGIETKPQMSIKRMNLGHLLCKKSRVLPEDETKLLKDQDQRETKRRTFLDTRHFKDVNHPSTDFDLK